MRPIRQKAVAICVKKAHGECDGGTFVSCLHDSEADCPRRIAEINPPQSEGDPGRMTLERGSLRGFQFGRMVMLFSMMDGENEIPCAVSNKAMDELEQVAWTLDDRREEQFLRLRDRIEQCASRKFQAGAFEGTPPGIILRSIDFRD